MVTARLDLSDIPYPGLRPFRPDEAGIFFGREPQTDELLSRLSAHRFLAVIGPSGCGKSSLVAAGLRPALATGFMVTAGAHWRVAELRPGGRPLHHLAAALLAAGMLDPERAAQSDAQAFLEAALRRGPLGLVEIMRSSPLARDLDLQDVKLLVFVDQFEELFWPSSGVNRDEAEAFVALLLASASAPDERIYVAITMRSDYLGNCTPFRGLPEAINDGLYLTPRLTRDECADCIVGPARVFGADVEPALVNRLLNDYGPDPDRLPLLQHALMRMWNLHEAERQAHQKVVLRIEDYVKVGELTRCLSNHANEAYAELEPEDRRIAELMFRRLSDSETAKRDQRAPAPARQIAELCGVTVGDVQRVADVFRRRDRCFLVPRAEVALGPETILDVSHESLLRQWDKAVAWIKDEADVVGEYRRLQDAVRDWRRGDGALWSGAKLDRAIAWRAGATLRWAMRYGAEGEFAAVCEFIREGEQLRETRLLRERRAQATRMRRMVATIAVCILAVGGASAWFVRPLLFVWPHTGYYASYVRKNGQPEGLRHLSRDKVRHRPLSFRIVRSGLIGHVDHMDAVNSRFEPAEVDPDVGGTARGRQLGASHWRYEYDARGNIAAEHQYTRQGEPVLSKIYVPLEDDREHLVVFIGADRTPTPVRGQSSESTYYWAQRLRYSERGYEELVRYLGPSGEPVTGDNFAFATRNEYDDDGHLVVTTSLDASGQPMNDTDGNSTLKIEYDADGNAVTAVALDPQGNRTRVDPGWTIRTARFDEFGNIIVQAYLDDHGRPVVTRSGWHSVTYQRDDAGNVRETRYFDQNGKPTPDPETACYGNTQQNDAMGRTTRWTCIDAGGRPAKTRDGWVAWAARYDPRGRLLHRAYLDAEDHASTCKDGYASELRTYDQKGRLTDITFRDGTGQVVKDRHGNAGYSITYSDAENVEWIRYVGDDGQPILGSDGYAMRMRKRDLWGTVIEERYFDTHQEPTIASAGYAGWRGTFDARGHRIETSYLGMTGEAVPNKDGYAVRRSEFDDLGREIAVHFLDAMGRPVTNIPDRVAGWWSKFDTWDQEVERMYFGPDGRPLSSSHGEAGWRAEYDPRGNQTMLQYLDANGQPTVHGWGTAPLGTVPGYAKVKRTFDTRSNLLHESYFDMLDRYARGPEDWSSSRHEYDEKDRHVRRSYYDTADRPMRIRAGYHAVTFEYDDRGNPIETRYFGIDGASPVIGDAGFARISRRYDPYDHLIEEAVYGVQGQPAVLHDGTHRTVTTWDRHGLEIREERWAPGEPPAKLGTTEYGHDLRGNLVEIRNLGPDGQPVATGGSPCATLAGRMSDRQELLELTCLGTDGKLFPGLKNAAARIAYSYELPGEVSQELYYGRDGRLIESIAGRIYTGVRYKYDSQGREIERTYLDERGNQVTADVGYARRTQVYDPLGNMVEQGFLLANDSPTTPVARIESKFDPQRRKVRERYFGPGRAPASLEKTGQHQTIYEYDEFGNLQALRYLDSDGNPTRGYARGFDTAWQLCYRWVPHYGADGKLVGNGECQQEPSAAAGKIDTN